MARIKEMRREQIWDWVKDHPNSTAHDIVKATDIPYVTVRRIITELVDLQRLKVVGYQHGRGGYGYETIELDTMPMITAFLNKHPAIIFLNEMTDRAKISADRKFVSDPVNSATNFIAVSLATIFHAAYEMAEDGDTDQRNIKGARETLLKCEKVFAEMARLCRSILDEPMFFDKKQLLRITQSKYWNSRQVVEAFRTFTEAEDKEPLTY